ncbi:acetyltransferase [Tautonia marina]|uniref:acetyltransferase n=1 Tax=Tautonia marina TaxID=2653855 RepID=UPI001261110C|nr:acetyltransferase [Tautonia marina]
MDNRSTELAERVRSALVRAAVEAYEDAGLSGLCAEGRWEAAVGAIRTLDLRSVCGLEESGLPPAPESSRTASTLGDLPTIESRTDSPETP